MAKKSRIAVIQDGIHEYTVKVKKKSGKGTKYKLFRSKGQQWTNPGELISTAIDDGNGITIDGVYYTYSQIEQLKILIDSMAETQDNLMATPKLFKNDNL